MFGDLIDGSHSDLDVIGIGSHVCSGGELYLVTHGGPNNSINNVHLNSGIDEDLQLLLCILATK